MLSLPEILIVVEYSSFSPFRPRKAAEHGHLVFAIYGDGVVNGGVRQSIAPPSAFATIEIGARVDGYVVTVNPQVHVELVGVGGTGGEVRAADEGVRVGGAEEEDAPIGE